MAKKKMKFDFAPVKKFLMEKGERVALGVFGGIALILIVTTMLGAMGAVKPEKGNYANYGDAFKAEKGKLDQKLASTEVDGSVIPEDKELPLPRWYYFLPRFFFEDPFFQLPEQLDTKRRRPSVEKPRPERVSVSIVQGGYFYHNIKPGKNEVEVFEGGAVGGGVGMPPIMPPGKDPRMPGGMPPMGGVDTGLQPVKKFKPVRFAMVGLVFPMKSQVDAYRLAMRLSTPEELLAKPELAPKPAGLIVWRSEKTDSGWSKPVELFGVNLKTGDTVFDDKNFKKTREMLQYAIYDRHEPLAYGEHVVGGLMNPLPLLANVEVPAMELDGITVDKDLLHKKKMVADAGGMPPMGGGVLPMPKGDGGGRPGLPGVKDRPMPMGGGGDGEARKTKWVDFDKFPRDKQRFLGKINAFPTKADLEGEAVIDPKMMGGVGMPPGVKPPRGYEKTPMADPMGGEPGVVAAVSLPDEALIRFLDADIYPGRTYKYFVKVRMHNPNHNAKAHEVAYEELTKDREVIEKDARAFYEVPKEVTPESEFNFYIVDEAPKVDIKGGSDDPKRFPAKAGESMAVQIHRWVQDLDTGAPVGDWAIAERLLVRKGEFIGRVGVKVEIPEWSERLDAFLLTTRAGKDKKDKKAKGEVAGVPIDFSADYSVSTSDPRKYALVDVEGGNLSTKAVSGGATLKEESSVNALILTPDGKLEVRSSRRDVDSAERKARVENWRKRLKDTVTGGEEGGAGGFPGTGVPPGM